jgi:hypothetical protein
MEYHNCRKCDNQYETHPRDGNSRNIDQYVKYMGLCSHKCWDKLTPETQEKELLFTYVYGDSRKQNNYKLN